jgi:plastocyanin
MKVPGLAGLAAICALAACSPAENELETNAPRPELGAIVEAVAGGFEPSAVTIEAGDYVAIVNADDGSRRYIALQTTPPTEPDAFRIDSGQQLPGERIEIILSAEGTVEVTDQFADVTPLVVTVTPAPAG